MRISYLNQRPNINKMNHKSRRPENKLNNMKESELNFSSKLMCDDDGDRARENRRLLQVAA
jgi:hypothetical protein